MAQVVNTKSIAAKMKELGWNLPVTEVVSGLTAASISAASFVAYLNSALANTDGFDDQAIAGCSAGDASKITTYLRQRFEVAV